MKATIPLAPDVSGRLAELGSIDLLVGIPSFNNARTIGHVVRAVTAGLAKFFPGMRAVCVNSDGGSTDGTPRIVAEASLASRETLLVAHPLTTVHRIVTPYHGLPGKGSAFRTIFAIAEQLGVRGCAVVDADLRSITPDWIELLLGPIVQQDFDYVAPLYLRHKHDGTITNSIVYPLTRALYGKDIRQPIGGDFGFSGRLASHYLTRPVWDTDVARFGIDIWMTTTAVAEGFRVCEAFLGAKIHDAKDPGTDLGDMLVQVISAVFDLMRTHEQHWMARRDVDPVPLFGFPHGVGLEPVLVDVNRMLAIFRQATRDLREIWQLALPAATLNRIVALEATDPGAFTFPPRLWVQTIYDFAIAYRQGHLASSPLLRSLVPLYLARTAGFVRETTHGDADDAERVVRDLADHFVSLKGYLVARWSDPTRQQAEETSCSGNTSDPCSSAP